MESITIKVNEEMAKSIEKAMKPNYATKTEFIRSAVRDKLEEWEKKQIIKELKKLQGSAKQKPNPLSQEEAFKNYLKKNPSEIFRKFNL